MFINQHQHDEQDEQDDHISHDIMTPENRHIDIGNSRGWTIFPDESLHTAIWSKLNEYLDFDIKNRKFPGAIPSSLMRTDIDNLFDGKRQYLVSEKTDGQHYLCFFTQITLRNKLPRPIIALLDRMCKWTLVRIPSKMSLFSGTLLDGELVKLKDGSFSFVVFDCLLSESRNMMDSPLLNRLKEVKSAITKMKVPNSPENSPENLDLSNYAFSVTTKQFLPTKDIRKLWTQVVPTLDHPSDGMIFTPVQTSVQVGHHPSLYKYKVGTFNTVDFLVKLVQGSPKSAKIPLIPYYGKLQDISSACILAELWTTRYVRGVHENVLYTTTYITRNDLVEMSLDKFVQVDNKVVECGWNPNDKMWNLKTVRNKPFSNILATIERTVENIEENIQPEELFTVLNI